MVEIVAEKTSGMDVLRRKGQKKSDPWRRAKENRRCSRKTQTPDTPRQLTAADPCILVRPVLQRPEDRWGTCITGPAQAAWRGTKVYNSKPH